MLVCAEVAWMISRFFLVGKEMVYGAGNYGSRRCGEMLKVDPRSELQKVKDKINIININRGVV